MGSVYQLLTLSLKLNEEDSQNQPNVQKGANVLYRRVLFRQVSLEPPSIGTSAPECPLPFYHKYLSKTPPPPSSCCATFSMNPEPNGPPQQQDSQRQAPAPPAAATATTTHVFSSTPTAGPRPRQALAPPAQQDQAGEGIGFLPSPPAAAISDPSAATAYKQQAFGVNPNPPFSAAAGGMNEDAGVGGVMDGGVGREAGGEGAGLKPPVPEQEFHDGVSDVQVGGSFFLFFLCVSFFCCGRLGYSCVCCLHRPR